MAEDFETFRDHFLSLYQSAVTAVARRLDAVPAPASRGGVVGRTGLQRSAISVLPLVAAEIALREYSQRRGLARPPDAHDFEERALSKGDMARVCAELAFRYLKAKVSGDTRATAEINDEFKTSVCDPAWATTIDEYLRYFGPSGTRQDIPYIRAASVGASTIEIPARARLALVGDWGTGADAAIQVLGQIRAMNPDVFIHLGDIYYSGTPQECESAFTSLINAVLRSENRDLPVFTLSGNHDMYCGGVGYYELIQTLNRPPVTQPASFFCLRSADEKWQFLAMDSGLHDYSPLSVEDAVTHLEDDELEWHCARIREFGGRTILLSHHQPFSAFSAIGKPDEKGCLAPTNPHLIKALNAFQVNGRIAAWFWGHEHTLTIYKPFAGLTHGRCIGHGAVPVSVRDDIYKPLPGLTSVPEIIPDTMLRQQGGVWAHGYAMLNLGPDAVAARYYQDVDGKPDLIYSETIR
jgi:hypothetical protein